MFLSWVFRLFGQEYTLFQKPGASMELRHFGKDKRIFFCPVYNALTACLLQAFGIRCMGGYSLQGQQGDN